MSDDFVLSVRQVTEYPLKAAADPGDAVLMQVGGLGGPYVYTTAYGVAQALGGPDGQVGVGVPLPGDAVGTGVIASNFIAPSPGCNIGWNFYQNSFGTQSFLGPGAAGLWCFNGTDLAFVFTPAGSAGQPIAEPPPVLNLDNTGYLDVANTVLVQRDPVAPTEVATKQYVDNGLQQIINNSVWSFNGRRGDIILLLADLTGAGGAPNNSPAFTGVATAPSPNLADSSNRLATTAFVSGAIAGAVDDLLAHDVVRTFNGRAGDVVLTLADVTGVGGAPLASPAFTGFPTAPTPLITSNDTSLATTAFVQEGLALLQTSLQGEIARIVTVSDSPPAGPQQGDLWWDSADTPHGGALYVWYIDGGFGSWVVANSQEGSVGPQGPPGSSIKGSYPTLADLQAAHPVGQVGDAYLVAGDMYVWDADTQDWLNVGSLVGPEGPMGPSGPPSFIVGTQPAPPVAIGSAWLQTPDHHLRFYDGTDWLEIGYLRTSGGTVTGDVTFDQDVTIKSELTVDEDAVFKRDVTVERDLVVDRDLEVKGSSTFGPWSNVGDVKLNGNLQVYGTTDLATHGGNVTVGSATNAANLTVRGLIVPKFAMGGGDPWGPPANAEVLLVTDVSQVQMPAPTPDGRVIRVISSSANMEISFTTGTSGNLPFLLLGPSGWVHAGPDFWTGISNIMPISELLFIAGDGVWWVINEGATALATNFPNGPVTLLGKTGDATPATALYTAPGSYVWTCQRTGRYQIMAAGPGGGGASWIGGAGSSARYSTGASGGVARGVLLIQQGQTLQITVPPGGGAAGGANPNAAVFGTNSGPTTIIWPYVGANDGSGPIPGWGARHWHMWAQFGTDGGLATAIPGGYGDAPNVTGNAGLNGDPAYPWMLTAGRQTTGTSSAGPVQITSGHGGNALSPGGAGSALIAWVGP